MYTSTAGARDELRTEGVNGHFGLCTTHKAALHAAYMLQHVVSDGHSMMSDCGPLGSFARVGTGAPHSEQRPDTLPVRL